MSHWQLKQSPSALITGQHPHPAASSWLAPLLPRTVGKISSRCILLIALFAVPEIAIADTPRFLFGTPRRMEELNGPNAGYAAPSVTADGLEMFFGQVFNGNDDNGADIVVSRRDSPDSLFGSPEALTSLNTELTDGPSSISADGLRLYFHGGYNDNDEFGEILMAERPTRGVPFGEPIVLFTSTDDERIVAPSISGDELSLYVQYGAPRANGGYNWDISVAQREDVTQPWGELTPIPQLTRNGTYFGRPSISADNRFLFFKTFNDAASRDNSQGELYMLMRSSPEDAWSRQINLGDAINTAEHDETFAQLSPDGRTFYFTRLDDVNDVDPLTYEIWESPVLPFEAINMDGEGDLYEQNFDSLGPNASEPGTALPAGWTFTANDVIFNDTTTAPFLAERKTFARLFNAGDEGDTDRTLATDYISSREVGEIDLRAEITKAPVQALRLKFDVEAWRVNREIGEAEFQVVLEVDSGNGFEQAADLGNFTTGRTLERPDNGDVVNGNDPAYRISQDSGPVEVNVPVGATLRTRWISTSRSRSVTFGLDNVSLQLAVPGDANIDGLFDSGDLVQVFQNGQYEDDIVGNSTWSDGDWNRDREFDSGDLVAAFQAGHYEDRQAATLAIPEPTALALTLSALLMLLSGRYRMTA